MEVADPGPSVLSFEGEPAGVSYQCWVEEICRSVVKTDVAPTAPGRVRFEMAVATLPNTRLAKFDGTAIKFTAQYDASPLLYLQMPVDANLRVNHEGRVLDVAPGRVALVDAIPNAQSLLLENGGFRTIGFDRGALLSLCPNAQDLVARPLNVTDRLHGLLQHYHEYALSSALEFDAVQRTVTSQHLLDLVALVLGAGRDQTDLAKSRGLAAARLAMIKTGVLEMLSDPRLSVAMVAEKHKVSPRYLHKLFEDEKMTFSEFVLSNRLDMARRMLTDARLARLKVSEIAFRAGFSDLSYFNRCFRRQFGLTPSEMRA